MLITASYRDQEFVRVGYYVNNEYDDPELKDNPPTEPQFDKLVRTIASDQPRVTKFKINWDSSSQVSTSSTTNDIVPNANVNDSEMIENLSNNQTLSSNHANINNCENKENINENSQQKLSVNNESSKFNNNQINIVENSHDSIMS